jgi:hypothetical protein
MAPPDDAVGQPLAATDTATDTATEFQAGDLVKDTIANEVLRVVERVAFDDGSVWYECLSVFTSSPTLKKLPKAVSAKKLVKATADEAQALESFEMGARQRKAAEAKTKAEEAAAKAQKAAAKAQKATKATEELKAKEEKAAIKAQKATAKAQKATEDAKTQAQKGQKEAEKASTKGQKHKATVASPKKVKLTGRLCKAATAATTAAATAAAPGAAAASTTTATPHAPIAGTVFSSKGAPTVPAVTMSPPASKYKTAASAGKAAYTRALRRGELLEVAQRRNREVMQEWHRSQQQHGEALGSPPAECGKCNFLEAPGAPARPKAVVAASHQQVSSRSQQVNSKLQQASSRVQQVSCSRGPHGRAHQPGEQCRLRHGCRAGADKDSPRH